MPVKEKEGYQQKKFHRLIYGVLRAAKGEEEVTYPNHRTKCIAKDEEGQPKEGMDRRDVELGLNTLEAGRVNCGTDVDGSCE